MAICQLVGAAAVFRKVGAVTDIDDASAPIAYEAPTLAEFIQLVAAPLN